ncbi:MAG TPA: hypothetical protein VJQ47_18105 [Steroidobacteraceae bacterium]|nr:hypothetical protein [Steroidobacteraceae bacterium]
MNVFSHIDTFTRLLGTMELDDSSLALLALLLGMIGGWSLTGWREQLKAKRAKVPVRKD